MSDSFSPDLSRSRQQEPEPAICLHGSLRRQCEACDLADRLEAAESSLATLRTQISRLMAERDHLDCTRREGGETRQCRVEAKCQRCTFEAQLATLRQSHEKLVEEFVERARELNKRADDAGVDEMDTYDAYANQGLAVSWCIERLRAALTSGDLP